MNKIGNVKNLKKEVILYSLQTHPFTIKTLITPKIISLIKHFEYKWVFRLHPRSNLDLNELNRFLKLNKIESRVIIQDAFNTPLPEVMTKSILHITNYSGCLIEALQLGIPTLLINEVGMEMFKQYIDGNLVFYLNKESNEFVNEFNGLINKLLKNNNASAINESIYNPLE
jgi:UDP-N-acetylglucosamine 2-epimerase